jgi:hypothetical protein
MITTENKMFREGGCVDVDYIVIPELLEFRIGDPKLYFSPDCASFLVFNNTSVPIKVSGLWIAPGACIGYDEVKAGKACYHTKFILSFNGATTANPYIPNTDAVVQVVLNKVKRLIDFTEQNPAKK